MGSKEQEILDFLSERVFDPILSSPVATDELKSGVRLTIMRLQQLDAVGMVSYFCSAIVGTEKSLDFSARMQNHGFTRFEEVQGEFLSRFDDEFLRS